MTESTCTVNGRLDVAEHESNHKLCAAMLAAVLDVPCGIPREVLHDLRGCLLADGWRPTGASSSALLAPELESSVGTVLVQTRRMVVTTQGTALPLPLPLLHVSTGRGVALTVFGTARPKGSEEGLCYPQFAFLCGETVHSIDSDALDTKERPAFLPPNVSHRQKRIQGKLEHKQVLLRLKLHDAGTNTDVEIGPHGIMICTTAVEDSRLVTCHVPCL